MKRGLVWAAVMGLVAGWAGAAAGPVTRPATTVEFVNTSFENASVVQWQIDEAGNLVVDVPYDYERSSPNRAGGHWHFKIEGKAGTDVTVILRGFDNVWNSRRGQAICAKTVCYVSADGKEWKWVPGELVEYGVLRVKVPMEADSMYLARLEPYRISDVERLIEEIKSSPLVEVTAIGKTVQGRPLEVIRIGNPKAPYRVVLRARAHPWEPGGNWVCEGLIRALLRDDAVSRKCMEKYCLYVMPMANKDGVNRGGTRFNALGKDLNRNWDKPADARAPENVALEGWIEGMIKKGQRPDLLIDLHNDESGKLHVSRPEGDLTKYLAGMERLEKLLRQHTWFTEGSTSAKFRNPGSIGEGMLERFGINGCVLELNANWIAGLQQPPSGKAWMQMGEGMRMVFYEWVGK